MLNEEIERFAEHYDVTVVPAHVRKPRDKSHVENAVTLTFKDIFTHIKSLHCPDLKNLNAAIRSALELHNNRPMTNPKYSRRSYFEDIEKDTLDPLNPIRYQIKKHVIATIGRYGYVRLQENIHFYSVPYIYINKKLKISYTTSNVFIYDGYTCVATHVCDHKEFRHTFKPEHLSPKHKAIMEWSPETFLAQAAEINEDVECYIRKILETKRYVDQTNKICSGILNLARKVGPAPQSRGILMDVIEDRLQKRATVITSQVPVKAWHDAIEEKTVADAILDRLVHHSLRVELYGESIRKRKTKNESSFH